MRTNLSYFFITPWMILAASTSCFASSIWQSTDKGFGLGPTAALYNINAGIATATSARTDYAFYTDSTCGGSGTTFGTQTGAYTFHNPSLVQANGNSLYSIAFIQSGSGYAQSVKSIQLAPTYANGVHLFADPVSFCFPVTYSNSAYIYGGAAHNTTLQ